MINDFSIAMSVEKVNEYEDKELKEYEVWEGGYSCTGNSASAEYLGNYMARNFDEACKTALIDKGRDMSDYDGKHGTNWGNFYDNEEDARKSFG